MTSKLLRKTELLFWDHAIPELTENPKLQSLVQSIYRPKPADPAKNAKLFYIFVAIGGLVFGTAAYILTHSL
jgi:hypothetical protein